ncbi:Cleavage and polyadenylation specificity factor subunit 4 [Cucumispora dikerogammari]|nr:Cleavage and polyadenylation specificity factor subunit 4 [Cucumispora dikerogammari]
MSLFYHNYKHKLRFKFEKHLTSEEHKLHIPIYCKKFQDNQCPFQTTNLMAHIRPKEGECPYAHLKLNKCVVCKHWLRKLCKKNNRCQYLHEYNLSRMPECWFFSKYGTCSNNECLFLHIDPDSYTNECQWYNRGFCRHGKFCRGKHTKRSLCSDFMEGFCSRGLACENGHPKVGDLVLFNK